MADDGAADVPELDGEDRLSHIGNNNQAITSADQRWDLAQDAGRELAPLVNGTGHLERGEYKRRVAHDHHEAEPGLAG